MAAGVTGIGVGVAEATYANPCLATNVRTARVSANPWTTVSGGLAWQADIAKDDNIAKIHKGDNL